MPGITGIIGPFPPQEGEAPLDGMVRCMMREEFYVSGMHVDQAMGLRVGWICHKGSFADCMPVWNETRDVGLVFTGEHFADGQELDRLASRGHDFHRENATSLVHLYEEIGIRFLDALNGVFAGVLLDLRKRTIVLFNDRYGLSRIYYHQDGGLFYFGSEAKSLLRVIPRLRQLDTRSFAEWHSCGCVLENRSLFRGVALLPGGAMWRFSPGGELERAEYFRPKQWEDAPRLRAHDYYGELRATFARILPRYTGPARRMAMSLTGGVDSRLVMAWAKWAPGTVPCYTFSGMYRECADVRVARQVAALCRQPYRSLRLTPDFFNEFPTLAAYTIRATDGAMDVSGCPDLHLNRMARQIGAVRLTGNYGGEILRGIVAFKPHAPRGPMLDREFARQVAAASQTYAVEADCRPLSFVAFKQVPWHHYSRFCLEQSQLTLRSPYLDNALVALAFQAPDDARANKEFSLRLVADGDPRLAKLATDRGVTSHPVPGLSAARRWWLNLTFKAEYAYDYGMPPWLAKFDRALTPCHPERIFLGRHKFYHFRVWYRDTLAGYVREVLLDPRAKSRPYMDGRGLERMVMDHTSGRGNYTSELHRAISAELIQRELIEPA